MNHLLLLIIIVCYWSLSIIIVNWLMWRLTASVSHVWTRWRCMSPYWRRFPCSVRKSDNTSRRIRWVCWHVPLFPPAFHVLGLWSSTPTQRSGEQTMASVALNACTHATRLAFKQRLRVDKRQTQVAKRPALNLPSSRDYCCGGSMCRCDNKNILCY